MKYNNSGTILVITLWVVFLLTIVAVTVSAYIRNEIKISQSFVHYSRVEWIKRAAANFVIAVLSKDTNSVDTLDEAWSNFTVSEFGINLFKNHEVGSGSFDVSYVYSEDLFSGQQKVFYGLVDEQRKINVNKATKSMLESLPGMTSEVATSILAWRGDSSLSSDILFNEDSYYKNLDQPYSRKSASIQCIEEMLLIKGINENLLYGKDINGNEKISLNEQGIIRYITTYGDGNININTAGVKVLTALGMEEQLAYKVLRYRLGSDGIFDTEDDTYFNNVDNIVTLLDANEPLSGEEKKRIEELKDNLTVTSSYYTGYITINLGSDVKKQIQIVIDKDNSKLERWIE